MRLSEYIVHRDTLLFRKIFRGFSRYFQARKTQSPPHVLALAAFTLLCFWNATQAFRRIWIVTAP